MGGRSDIPDMVVQALEEDEVSFHFGLGGTAIETNFIGDALVREAFVAAASESLCRSTRQ